MITEQSWKNYTSKLKIKESKKPLKQIKQELTKLLINSIKKRIPKERFAILFSGGLDSSFIALIAEKLKANFTCYVTGFKNSKDIKAAKEIAKKLNFKLKVINVNLKQLEKKLPKITKLITTSTVKLSISLPIYFALKQVKEKIVFTGSGSEELFAGYQRYKTAKNINKECLEGLKTLYQRDLSRDLTLMKHFKKTPKLPFLDDSLIKYALTIPGKRKVNKQEKYILRIIADKLGLKQFAYRPKTAAQYGSRLDKALKILTRKAGYEYRYSYLTSFNKDLALLFTAGKDSNHAYHLMKDRIKCLLTMKSKNPDSYMFHTPTIDLVRYQAKVLDLPLLTAETKGKKELELKDLEKLIKSAKKIYKIKGIVTGALYSEYQRSRIAKICKKLNLKLYNPLWHANLDKYMKEITKKYKVIISSIAAPGMKDMIGKQINLKKLKELNISISGEGGEYESLVLDSPNFRKSIQIEKSEIIPTGSHSARLKIKRIKLIPKTL